MAFQTFFSLFYLDCFFKGIKNVDFIKKSRLRDAKGIDVEILFKLVFVPR